MKMCARCSVVKDDVAFYSLTKGYCKDCQQAYDREWAKQNRARKLANNRRWREQNRERRRLMVSGSNAVYKAIERGFLIRPGLCEQCGSNDKIEAAHDNYGKPLSVKWLCRKCHRLYDAAVPKTA